MRKVETIWQCRDRDSVRHQDNGVRHRDKMSVYLSAMCSSVRSSARRLRVLHMASVSGDISSPSRNITALVQQTQPSCIIQHTQGHEVVYTLPQSVSNYIFSQPSSNAQQLQCTYIILHLFSKQPTTMVIQLTTVLFPR